MVEFSVLNSCIHGFTERSGGVSKAPFDSLNLGFNSGDALENVEKNIEILLKDINFEGDSIYYMDQVHGNAIEDVKVSEQGFIRVAETDGIMTSLKGVLLMSTYADCVPILFHCKEAGLVALAHSGWKGTKLEIGKKMIDQLNSDYGVALEDINVAIGPAAGPCCYEVDSRVRDAFLGYDKYSTYVDREHVMLDLKGIVKEQLLECGIPSSNIEVSELCTICNESRFFSYRRSGRTGRMLSFIGMK